MERGARGHPNPATRPLPRGRRGDARRYTVSNESLPIDDLRAIAEVLADVLAERGVVAAEQQRPQRVLTAADVAEILDRDRRWVYAHAGAPGAFRYDGFRGGGPWSGCS